MRLKFLGTGDAFGSGGRFNTCFLAERGEQSFLIDCGASAMISMRRFGADPNRIGGILLSHLHGDHFGGLPFFILDAQFVSKRTRPLLIAGPEGTSARLEALMEVMFPGSAKWERKFAIEHIELKLEKAATLGALGVLATAFPVIHPSGFPSLALRLDCDGKVISYSGDTEWTDSLVDAARGADLCILECYWYQRKGSFHLDWHTLREKLPLLEARRVILTHLSQEMLKQVSAIPLEVAADGLEVEI